MKHFVWSGLEDVRKVSLLHAHVLRQCACVLKLACAIYMHVHWYLAAVPLLPLSACMGKIQRSAVNQHSDDRLGH